MSKTLSHEQIWGYVADQVALHDCPLKFNGLCLPDCAGHCRRHIEEMQTLAPPAEESDRKAMNLLTHRSLSDANVQ